MKFNLKNQPRKYLTLNDEKIFLADYIREFHGWFEGFEKELRERLEQMKGSNLSEARIRREVYKEILGE